MDVVAWQGMEAIYAGQCYSLWHPHYVASWPLARAIASAYALSKSSITCGHDGMCLEWAMVCSRNLYACNTPGTL